jgi:hypothetical protein
MLRTRTRKKRFNRLTMIRLNTTRIAAMTEGAGRMMRINYFAALGTLNQATQHMKSSDQRRKNRK